MAVLIGTLITWTRMRVVRRLSTKMHKEFQQRKQAVLADAASSNPNSVKAANYHMDGESILAAMGDLKTVYRWRDVRQLSLICRDMRLWDEDGVADPEAAQFGEFVLKVCLIIRAATVAPAAAEQQALQE